MSDSRAANVNIEQRTQHLSFDHRHLRAWKRRRKAHHSLLHTHSRLSLVCCLSFARCCVLSQHFTPAVFPFTSALLRLPTSGACARLNPLFWMSHSRVPQSDDKALRLDRGRVFLSTRPTTTPSACWNP